MDEPAIEAEQRRRAIPVPVVLAAVLAWGLVLVLAFDSDVQTIDADELVAQRDDARAFLIADYVFIVLYALALPLVMWRFGAALGHGRPPRWIQAGVMLLFAAGIVDAAENAILLSATDAISRGAVDTAHALAAPKIALFAAGALAALVSAAAVVLLLRESP